MHLIYFLVDGPQMPTLDTIKKYGLDHIRLTGGVQPRQCLSGPSGLSGVLVAAGDVPSSALRFSPDDQQWAFAPDAFCGPSPDLCSLRRWAVCYSKSSGSPGPSELAREKQLDSRPVTLADGHEWLVPIARQWFEAAENDPPLAWQHTLPRAMRLDSQGQWSPGDVLPKYRQLWDKAIAYETALYSAIEEFNGGNANAAVNFDSASLACLALGFNYHLSPVEISLLGLFDTDSVQAVIDTVTDAATLNRITRQIREAQLKKVDRQEAIQGSGPGLTLAAAETNSDTTIDMP